MGEGDSNQCVKQYFRLVRYCLGVISTSSITRIVHISFDLFPYYAEN